MSAAVAQSLKLNLDHTHGSALVRGSAAMAEGAGICGRRVAAEGKAA